MSDPELFPDPVFLGHTQTRNHNLFLFRVLGRTDRSSGMEAPDLLRLAKLLIPPTAALGVDGFASRRGDA